MHILFLVKITYYIVHVFHFVENIIVFQVDCSILMLMDDTDLIKYLPKYGDRVAVIHFAKAQQRRKETTKRKMNLIDTLSRRFKARHHQSDDLDKPGPSKSDTSIVRKPSKNASKKARAVEIGWLDYEHSTQVYRQVRTKDGGGVRKITVSKMARKSDILEEGKKLFFPQGISSKGRADEYKFDVMDYQEHILDEVSSVGEIYRKTCFPILRLYLSTKKQSKDEDTSDDDELPVVDLSTDNLETSNSPPFLSTANIPRGGSRSDDPHMNSVQSQDVDVSVVENVNIDDPQPQVLDDSDIQFGPFDQEDHEAENATLPLDDVLLYNHPQNKREIRIHRCTVLKDMIETFKDPTILSDFCCFKMILPNGDEEMGEGEGVTKDCLSEFWGNFYDQCTTGSRAKVPYLRHDFSYEEWSAVGRIIVLGWTQCKYFPVQLALPFMESVTIRRPTCDLIDSFLMFLPEEEADIISSALKDYESIDQDDLFDVLSNYNCRNVPSKGKLEKIIMELAHKELVQAPTFVANCWRREFGPIKGLDFKDVVKQLSPTSRKVVSKLSFPDKMTAEQETTANHLQRMVRSIEMNILKKFLRFCTGSDLLPDRAITVSFNNMTGLERRPVAHACPQILDLPTMYDDFPQFRSEFKNILESGVWAMELV